MKDPKANGDVPGSFRDPSGFLFYRKKTIYRQVNRTYKDNYDHLMNSGLHKALVDEELLIPCEEADIEGPGYGEAYKIIKPEMIKFISYPYEWSFSQLKDAALTTLAIQKRSLDYGISLKDCSAYNIQFRKCKPVFIDSLSFEKYEEGKPWVAYKQFCQHFLAPLSLMSYRDIRLNQLFRIYMDGIPLDLAGSLLPFRTRFKFSLLTHIHLHARSQKRYADRSVDTGGRSVSRMSFLGLIDSLETAVRGLAWRPEFTEWADYYTDTNYSQEALQHKREIVADFLEKTDAACVWDLGANDGFFSRIASDSGIETVAFDIDPAAVEKNYLECKRNGEIHILPLLLDLTNPSPPIGWENRERMSLFERGPVDVIFALALIHHLAISNNLPFRKIAEYLHGLSNSLIVEFAPKTDSQVQRLLATREDIFPRYTRDDFEREFARRFTITSSIKIKGSERTMYLMHRE